MSNPIPLHGPQLLERFQALDSFLRAYQDLWRPKPFTYLELPWEIQHPELAAWLRQRSLADAEAAHNQPARLQAPSPFPELAAQSAALSAIGALPQSPPAKLPARFAVDMPGRKWEQIQAFASRLQFHQQPQHWLDWCAGKGHLGHLLAHDGNALTCLEYNPELVQAGQHLSQRRGLLALHLQQDVLAIDAETQLRAEHTPVALHACGDLHVRLIQLASAAGCAQLAIAPCCYNRIST
ncbi:MAG: methyltransferase, partial [Pseudomonas sp.]